MAKKEEKSLPIILYPDANEQPHKFQKMLHYYANKPGIRCITVVMPRQQGKSTCIRKEVINQMIKKPGLKVLWTTPRESQGVTTFEMLEQALAPIIRNTKRTHSQFQITLKNNSSIWFKPTTSIAIRSMVCDVVVVDEIQDVLIDDLRNKVTPVLLANKNSLRIIAGTPAGTSNILYDYFRRSELYPNMGYATVHCEIDNIYTDYPNPKTDIQLVEMERLTMPANQFDAEYRAKFVSGNGFFTNVDELAVIDPFTEINSSDELYAGVDVALVNDKFSLVLVNQNDEMVYCYTVKGASIIDLKEHIQFINSKYKVKYWQIESNNQGLPLIQLLMLDRDNPMYNIYAWPSTTENKIKIINAMQAKLQRKENKIKLLNRKDVKEEFNAFEVKKKDGGGWKMAAPHGMGDDIVISTCCAFACKEEFHKSGEYSWAVI